MFKPVQDFRAEEPAATDLRRLQNAVYTAFQELPDERRARPQHTRAYGSVAAEYDQTIEMGASGTVTLPPLLPENVGRSVTVILTSSTISVTVRPTDGALIQNTTSDGLGTVGRYEYVCGITGWYR